MHLLDVEGRRLLIASTPQQITLLAELPSTTAPQPVEGAGSAEGFREHLQRLTARNETPSPEALPEAEEPEAPAPLQPETLSDEELREEVRRKLLTLNRSADGIARLRQSSNGGNGETWRGR